jgi:hypothetical protein
VSKPVKVIPPAGYVPGSKDARIYWNHAEVMAIAYFARLRLRAPDAAICNEHFETVVLQIEQFTLERAEGRRRLSRNDTSRKWEKGFPIEIIEAVELVENALEDRYIKGPWGSPRITTQAILDWAEMQRWDLQDLLREFHFERGSVEDVASAVTAEEKELQDGAQATVPPPYDVVDLPDRLQIVVDAWRHFKNLQRPGENWPTAKVREMKTNKLLSGEVVEWLVRRGIARTDAEVLDRIIGWEEPSRIKAGKNTGARLST